MQSHPPEPRPQDGLGRVRWHQGSLDDLAPGLADSLVWLVRTEGDAAAAALARVRPNAADLADAARAREEGGLGRLVRRRLLRALAARIFVVHPDLTGVDREPGGALRLVAPQVAFASVSGSGGWAAIALSPVPIGVDLEPSGEVGESHWPAREAYLKALGIGLRLDPERVSCRLGQDGLFDLEAVGSPPGRAAVLRDGDMTAAAAWIDAA